MSLEKDFFNKYAPIVQKYDSILEPSIRLAQMALESDWGRSELAINANNFGGIKASPPWSGEIYYKNTQEWDNKKQEFIFIKAPFAKFKTFDEFAQYKANFLQRTEQAKTTYAKVFTAKTILDKTKALTGTYATDPNYSTKLIDLINKYNLTQYDKTKTEKEVVNTMVNLRIPKDKITLVNTFGRYTNVPKYIVIHYVGAVGQAADNANYFYNVVRNASAHIFIDKNETWRVGYDDMGMWHIGKLAV